MFIPERNLNFNAIDLSLVANSHRNTSTYMADGKNYGIIKSKTVTEQYAAKITHVLQTNQLSFSNNIITNLSVEETMYLLKNQLQRFRRVDNKNKTGYVMTSKIGSGEGGKNKRNCDDMMIALFTAIYWGSLIEFNAN